MTLFWASFSPDGRRIATASEDHTARLWELPKEERPLDDLRLHSELLSGQQIDAAFGLIPVTPAVLRSAWDKLRIKSPNDFAATAE